MSGLSAIRTRAHPSPRRKRKLKVSERSETVVDGKGVWKIFGHNVDHALDAMRSQVLDKERVLDEFGAIVAVADVSFEVTRGEIFCVMGLSGSGKSTLIRHINRLIKPTAGELLVGGVDINGLSDKEMLRLRSEKIGMVFQKMALFPHWSIADNVSFGLEVLNVPKQQRRERSQEMLELVQLGDLGKTLSGRTVGWHAAARRVGQGAGDGSGTAVDGRTLQCPGSADPAAVAG